MLRCLSMAFRLCVGAGDEWPARRPTRRPGGAVLVHRGPEFQPACPEGGGAARQTTRPQHGAERGGEDPTRSEAGDSPGDHEGPRREGR